MEEAGYQNELKAVLLDLAWIAVKLAATNMPGLLADMIAYLRVRMQG